MKVDASAASDLLGYLLSLDRAELYLKIKQAADAHRGYLTIKRKLTPDEYDNLLNFKSQVDWVSLSHESQRHYPNGTLAAPVFELTAIYQAARYGGKPADPQQATSLINRIRTFLRKK